MQVPATAGLNTCPDPVEGTTNIACGTDSLCSSPLCDSQKDLICMLRGINSNLVYVPVDTMVPSCGTILAHTRSQPSTVEMMADFVL